tara:strand:- start:1499 stop:2215 length:717 start_codon:yes stop_codon:yes gene_type:complete
MTRARDLANIISGGFTDADIPALPASKITSGSFADGRIPNLAASKVTSGAFDAARLTNAPSDYVALSTVTISSLTTELTFDNLPTTYDTFDIHVHLHPNQDNDMLVFYFIDENGNVMSNGAKHHYTYSRGNDAVTQDPYHSYMKVGTSVGTNSHEGIRLVCRLVGRNYTDVSTKVPPQMFGHWLEFTNGGVPEGGTFVSGLDIYGTNADTPIRGVQFKGWYGNGWIAGEGSVFGVKNA